MKAIYIVVYFQNGVGSAYPLLFHDVEAAEKQREKTLKYFSKANSDVKAWIVETEDKS